MIHYRIPFSIGEIRAYVFAAVGRKLGNKLFKSLRLRHTGKAVVIALEIAESLFNRLPADILFNFEAFRRAECSVFADYALYNYVARFGTSAVFTIPSEKKIRDSCVVSRLIWEALRETPLRDAAAVRHLRTLRGYYLHCIRYSAHNCGPIRSEMLSVAREAGDLGRNMTINVNLIRYCPWLFRLVYTVYDKVRKPQWEARKES